MAAERAIYRAVSDEEGSDEAGDSEIEKNKQIGDTFLGRNTRPGLYM